MMIFPAGEEDLSLKDVEGGISVVKSVVLNETYYRTVNEMRPLDIIHLRDADRAKIGRLARGTPFYWAFDKSTFTLMLYPVPDTVYNAFIKYYPALREI